MERDNEYIPPPFLPCDREAKPTPPVELTLCWLLTRLLHVLTFSSPEVDATRRNIAKPSAIYGFDFNEYKLGGTSRQEHKCSKAGNKYNSGTDIRVEEMAIWKEERASHYDVTGSSTVVEKRYAFDLCAASRRHLPQR